MVKRVVLIVAMLASAMAMALATGPASAADHRVAFVVGNSHYKNSSYNLENPDNDARAVAAKLKALGFDTVEAYDYDLEQFGQALQKFSSHAQNADAVLFYYAGHAMQLEGKNYLMPVDADPKTAFQAKHQMINLDEVHNALDRSSGVKIMILDACRDNPMAKRIYANRSLGGDRGLARVDVAQGLITFYAAAPGDVASDGQGGHSPFTKALLDHIGDAGVDIIDMFRLVSDEVKTNTGGRQTPNIDMISAPTSFFLVSPEFAWDKIKDSHNPDIFRRFIERYPNSAQALIAKEQYDKFKAENDAKLHWETIRNLKDPEAFRDFIKQYPNSVLSDFAHKRLTQLAANGWDQIKSSNDPDDFRTFADQFPDSVESPLAQKRGDELRRAAETWNRIKESGNLDEFRQFVERYPNSAQMRLAQRQYQELKAATENWDRIKYSNNPNDFRKFIRSHPLSANADLALKQLSKLLESPQRTDLAKNQPPPVSPQPKAVPTIKSTVTILPDTESAQPTGPAITGTTPQDSAQKQDSPQNQDGAQKNAGLSVEKPQPVAPVTPPERPAEVAVALAPTTSAKTYQPAVKEPPESLPDRRLENAQKFAALMAPGIKCSLDRQQADAFGKGDVAGMRELAASTSCVDVRAALMDRIAAVAQAQKAREEACAHEGDRLTQLKKQAKPSLQDVRAFEKSMSCGRLRQEARDFIASLEPRPAKTVHHHYQAPTRPQRTERASAPQPRASENAARSRPVPRLQIQGIGF